ncbi:peptidoglycan-binding domain-containing protein [Clostridium sp.]|uniref:peptidoglycan-binding domain-containing protein n=1 Tax=Clostridium sp. TaxID=1506 RepID=UPI002FDD6A4B
MKLNKIKFNKLMCLVITTSIIGTSILTLGFNAEAADPVTSTISTGTTTATTTDTGNSNVQNITNLPTLKYSSTGQYVYLLQSYFNIIKVCNPQLPSTFSQLEVDGVFGAKTLNNVKVYQEYKNLTVDGVVGQQTWNALHKDIGY